MGCQAAHEMMKDGRSTFGALKTCLCRLNHTTFVILLTHHFLSPALPQDAINHPVRRGNTGPLRPWVKFLMTAHLEILMN
jgi:hypothetical protein